MIPERRQSAGLLPAGQSGTGIYNGAMSRVLRDKMVGLVERHACVSADATSQT